MLFSRRNPVSWQERLRVAVWPRRSWARSTQYLVKRVLRLTASPHSVAAGVAAGVFASFTPFLGFHFMIAFAVSYVIAGNLIAAAAGTFFGNPLTFPFIWASTYGLGRFILSGAQSTVSNTAHQRMAEIAHSNLIELGLIGLINKIDALWEPVIKPMAIGAVPIGTMVAICFYLLTRWAAVKFRHARLKRLTERARSRTDNGATPPKASSADTLV
ncbi:MAG: DUF2062 domain-containing protein [Salaquimonas sp.]|jgi:hypothetical protein|nr:DUF2062 domain-containing protein [Salaquimonas sp.]